MASTSTAAARGARGCVGRRGGRAVEGCRGMGGGSGRCRSGERAPSSSSCGCMEATGALVDVSVDGGGGVLRGARVASEAVGRWTGVVPGPCRAPNHQPHRRSAVMYLPSRRGRLAGDRQVEESPAPPEGWAPRKAFLPYSLPPDNVSCHDAGRPPQLRRGSAGPAPRGRLRPGSSRRSESGWWQRSPPSLAQPTRHLIGRPTGLQLIGAYGSV